LQRFGYVAQVPDVPPVQLGAKTLGVSLVDFPLDGLKLLIDLGDVLYIVSYLYKGGPAPFPLEVGDADCDGDIDLGDLLYLVSYLYKGGPAPGCP